MNHSNPIGCRIADAVEEQGGALLVTSSHGNCEVMLNAKGKPHPGHTHSPVPFIYFRPGDEAASLREDGSLSDVAATVLELLDLEKPAAMSGRSLRGG